MVPEGIALKSESCDLILTLEDLLERKELTPHKTGLPMFYKQMDIEDRVEYFGEVE